MKRIECTIEKLGSLGDGIAVVNGKELFVPFTVPGDKIIAQIFLQNKNLMRGRAVEFLEYSKNRQTPICKHFMKCGGCDFQHFDANTYDAFKLNILQNSIQRAGFDNKPELVKVPAYSRRRVDFKIDKTKLGFYGVRTHDVVDLEECHVVRKDIFAIAEALKPILQTMRATDLHISISKGFDVLVTCTKVPRKDALIEFAKNNNIYRMAYQVNEQVEILYSQAEGAIDVPIASFMQATSEGENFIKQIIQDHIADVKNVIDLYSGYGAFSRNLAEAGLNVDAYEGDELVLLAAQKSNSENLQFHLKDLFLNPVKASELTKYDLAIINPPRNGAETQVEELAAARTKRIIMVSCNPLTMERDAKILKEAGYKLDAAFAVDQFVWSKHLESVLIFLLD